MPVSDEDAKATIHLFRRVVRLWQRGKWGELAQLAQDTWVLEMADHGRSVSETLRYLFEPYQLRDVGEPRALPIQFPHELGHMPMFEAGCMVDVASDAVVDGRPASLCIRMIREDGRWGFNPISALRFNLAVAQEAAQT